MEWNQARLEALIKDQIEEGLKLEYKRAASLADRDEITKDISAMANAAGGVIVYGIGEHERPKHHLPERLDPVDRTKQSKERLDQIINSAIHPAIVGVKIIPVPLNTGKDDAAYVVEVPEGVTAHQAADHKYYRRYNFECKPMYDHEIRDVMARGQHPRIKLEFEAVWKSQRSGEVPPRIESYWELRVFAKNEGTRLAEYVHAVLTIPAAILSLPTAFHAGLDSDLFALTRDFKLQNTKRDQIGRGGGIHRHVPVLPGRREPIGDAIDLDEQTDWSGDGAIIRWEVSADNAPVVTGEIRLSEIRTIDRRSADHRAGDEKPPKGAKPPEDPLARLVAFSRKEKAAQDAVPVATVFQINGILGPRFELHLPEGRIVKLKSPAAGNARWDAERYIEEHRIKCRLEESVRIKFL